MSLMRELKNPSSPLRRFFDERLPHTSSPRATYSAAMADASTVLPTAPPGANVPWDVLGHAISARLLWQLDPNPCGRIAGRSAQDLADRAHDDEDRVGAEIVDEFRCAIDAGPGSDEDLAARVSWIGGLLDRAYRSGRVDDWFEQLVVSPTWPDMLKVVPDWAAADVAAMAAVCQSPLSTLAAPVAIAPLFAGSFLVGGADADLMAGGVLIDVKATNDLRLSLKNLQQIVSYALLDFDDTYEIEAVGILAARQGVLVRWPLATLLQQMSGASLGVAEAREQLRLALAG